MRKTIAILALTIIMGLTSHANAGGIWDMIKNSTSDGKIETKQYEIEVAFTNVRGYVYNVPEMKSVCFSVYAQGSQTLQCKTYKEMGLTDKEINE